MQGGAAGTPEGHCRDDLLAVGLALGCPEKTAKLWRVGRRSMIDRSTKKYVVKGHVMEANHSSAAELTGCWTSDTSSLGLSFLICKMEIIRYLPLRWPYELNVWIRVDCSSKWASE